MPNDASLTLLKRLCLAMGPPGAEGPVRRVVREALSDVGSTTHDRLGSILCERPGASRSPRIALDAHLDEVAFLVQAIDVEGRLRFHPLGGWWGHVLLAQPVHVLSDDGPVAGVIASKPPHFLTAAEREKVQTPDMMTIDVGSSTREQTEALGIRVGDPVVPRSEFVELDVPRRVRCKAIDDRVGVAVMCCAMQSLADREHPNTVIGVGAVQEEVGLRGGGTAAAAVEPDVAIVLECTPADDLPGQDERQAVLGGGPQIRLFDPTALPNRRLARFVGSVAGEEGIDIQWAVRRTGGTNAGSIHLRGRGVPTVVLGVPGRYIHTHHGILDLDDFDAACHLTTAVLERLDAATLDQFLDFD